MRLIYIIPKISSNSKIQSWGKTWFNFEFHIHMFLLLQSLFSQPFRPPCPPEPACQPHTYLHLCTYCFFCLEWSSLASPLSTQAHLTTGKSRITIFEELSQLLKAEWPTLPSCGQFSSVHFSRSVMSDSLWPHGLQQLLELTQTPVHWVSDAIQPSHPLSSPSPPAFSLSQHQGLFQWVSS